MAEKIIVSFRQKGAIRSVEDFRGRVVVLGDGDSPEARLQTRTEVPREELGLRDGKFDLSRVPVVAIGGKAKHRLGRVSRFLEENARFSGAFLCFEGSGNWDLDNGVIVLTSKGILSGRPVSGGRPEVELTDYRWLTDGRYVADRARMLHGKVLDTLAAEVEQIPPTEKLAESLTATWGRFDHPLQPVVEAVRTELYELEGRRVVLTGEEARDMNALVLEHLGRKLVAAGVRYVRDVPASLTLTAAEVDPELVAARDNLGTIEIPGVGRRLATSQRGELNFGRPVVTVKVTAEEFRAVTAWPFPTIYPVIGEIGEGYGQLNYRLEEAVESPEAERLGKLREHFAQRWLDAQRVKNYPQDVKVADPHEADAPVTPEPVAWGYDLMTGETFTAYAALVHDVRGAKGRIYDDGWRIRWFDNAAEAAEAKGRREARSFETARRIEAELTAEAEAVELPAPVPAAFVPCAPTAAEILGLAGFTPGQYRVREDVGHWYSAGSRGGRDDDGKWYGGASPSGHFAEKARDGVWEIGQTGLSHLFEGGQVGEYRREAFVQPVLAVMGAGEKIPAIKAKITADREAAEEAYRANVRRFIEALRAEPAFASLSPETQAELTELASRDWGIPSIEEEKLRREWANAQVLYKRENSGEVLANWGGHFRVMGASGNCDYWVICPDGTLREPDTVEYRKRYTSEGEKQWRLVGPKELALTWSKAYTAADHEFRVAKLPAGGCTAEQLATIERLEREISEKFHGTTGISGRVSPMIGKGWGLKPTPAPIPASAPVAEKGPAIEAAGLNLTGLFGGAATVSSRKPRR
ncbi:MAG: hypothetical protein WC730_02230 [Patescibacteria group bacterium]|jgi:hypothetical protein